AMDKFRADPEEWITLRGQEIMEEATKKEKGAILVFGHIGNWELIPIIYEMLNIQGFAIASPIGEAKLDGILAKKRFSENVKMIPRGDKKAARNILSAFRNNRVMLFALDQDMNVQSHFVDFFGRKAATAKGAANLAMKFDAPVMSCFGFRDEQGKHHYEIKLLSDGPYEKGMAEEIRLTQSYTTAIETKIKAHPSQWVWFHRRWKTQPDEVE
ncbi:MAG: lysophospholipid acyltransferase family protein, partial [SAR324 cluster bacterium]|nr:lysophospholipid acyltransferase family protein [SAR324 cluster bacterium]